VQTAYAADDLPSRAVRQAYDYVLSENSVENYQEFIRLYPHDPLCDRIRALLASLVVAQAWHNAVITNSPVAYHAFYDKYSNSPYARNALKLAEQPKMIPLSQPKQILLPPTVKLGGLGSQGGLDKTAVEKLGNGGQIVTLKPIGANAASGNSGVGKIVELPGVNKTATLQDSKLNGTLQNSKLNAEAAHLDGRPAKLDDRPVKSFSHVNSQPAEFRKGSGFTNGGNSFHMAQFHGSGFQPMGRSGGMMMRR
jgi:hypothetical protein